MENRELSILEKAKAKALKLYNTVAVDVLYHAAIKGSMMVGGAAVKGLMKLTPSMLPKDSPRLDQSDSILTRGHHFFRHEEMEMFIPESKLKESVELLKYATQVYAGEESEPTAEVKQKLQDIGMFEELQTKKGSYLQHYPFFFRKVLPEDTMISMAASKDEAPFSMSIFSYKAPEDREAYYDFNSFLSRCMSKVAGARLHWGKHFNQKSEQVAASYPELEKFKAFCRETDPSGCFRNDYTARVLDFPSEVAERVRGLNHSG